MPSLCPDAGQADDAAARRRPRRLLVLCGSMHPASVEQVRLAEKAGFDHVALSPEEKFDPSFWATPAGAARLTTLAAMCEKNDLLITSFEQSAEDAAFLRRTGLSAQCAADHVSASLSRIYCSLLSGAEQAGRADLIPLLTGGDTLRACLRAAGIRELRPLRELTPGVVLSRIHREGAPADAATDRRPGGPALLLSKSGGFGEPDLLLRLREMKSGLYDSAARVVK